ncbi:hypothetical protein [Bradyrhizobium sacchari]|uniref:hypothetical protein n=1 Tax=Bradyrhizobium sacchari TaxID=1399419 RepID=UPI0013747B75
MLRPPGVGQTYLPNVPRREAILFAYTVQFTAATALVAGFVKAHGKRRLDEKLLVLTKPKLPMVGQLDYR